jgi:hypothetical protein
LVLRLLMYADRDVPEAGQRAVGIDVSGEKYSD